MKNPNELIEALEEFFSPEVLKKLNRELNNIYSDHKKAIKEKKPLQSLTGKFDEPLYGKFSQWQFTFQGSQKGSLMIIDTAPALKGINSRVIEALKKLIKLNTEEEPDLIKMMPKDLPVASRVIFNNWSY